MKKTQSFLIISTLTILTVMVIGGCSNPGSSSNSSQNLSSNPKYTRDISSMSPENKAKEEKLLKENLPKIDSAKNNAEKVDALGEVGFIYMSLGQYDKAIPDYEKVLPLDPINYPALTNLAVMYEEVGEIQKALGYEQKLFQNYADDSQVLQDYVRMSVEIKDYVRAYDAVDAYSKTEKGKKNPDFVKAQQEFIAEAKNKK